MTFYSIGGGELFDRVIEDEFVLTERACRVFVKQILEGVNYIHRQGIIHLDLKVIQIKRYIDTFVHSIFIKKKPRHFYLY